MTVQQQAAGDAVRLQQRRSRRDGWTKAKRARFLEELAETCNISEAARTIGKSRQSAYALRRRDADFARDWEDALDQGYAEIEAMLIRMALHGCESEEIVEDGEGVVKTRKVRRAPHPSLGLQLLKLHAVQVAARRAARGEREGPGSPAAIVSVERVLAEIKRRRAAAGT